MKDQLCLVGQFTVEMRTFEVQDGHGESLTVKEDAGLYISPNIPSENVINLANFQARSDDILVVTYPKSGTHWMQAIANLVVQNVESLSDGLYMKYTYHLDFTPLQVISDAPSPRVICTHMPLERIPLDFLRMRSKIVLCVRDPRDVAVSYFRFCANLKPISYKGNFDGFFNLFMNGNLPYNSWFDHVFSWLKAAKSGRHDIHVVRYEDLQQNFLDTLSALVQYLEVDSSPELLERVQKVTSFQNMKTSMVDYLKDLSVNGQSIIFRKGTVGDWRNYFNETQLAMLDDEMKVWGLHKNKNTWLSID